MREFLMLLGVLVLWIVLNRWVLLRFGIHTCMSGGCATDCCPTCGSEPWHSSDKDVADATEDAK